MNWARWLRDEGPAWFAGAALGLAGLLKAGRPLELGRALEGYAVLPPTVIPPLAAWLPWLEIATGALLLTRGCRLGAAFVAIGLAAGFLAGGVSVLVRGLDAACGCFGDWSGPVGPLTIVVQVMLLAAAGLAARRAWRVAAAAHSPS